MSPVKGWGGGGQIELPLVSIVGDVFGKLLFACPSSPSKTKSLGVYLLPTNIDLYSRILIIANGISGSAKTPKTT